MFLMINLIHAIIILKNAIRANKPHFSLPSHKKVNKYIKILFPCSYCKGLAFTNIIEKALKKIKKNIENFILEGFLITHKKLNLLRSNFEELLLNLKKQIEKFFSELYSQSSIHTLSLVRKFPSLISPDFTRIFMKFIVYFLFFLCVDLNLATFLEQEVEGYDLSSVENDPVIPEVPVPFPGTGISWYLNMGILTLTGGVIIFLLCRGKNFPTPPPSEFPVAPPEIRDQPVDRLFTPQIVTEEVVDKLVDTVAAIIPDVTETQIGVVDTVIETLVSGVMEEALAISLGASDPIVGAVCVVSTLLSASADSMAVSQLVVDTASESVGQLNNYGELIRAALAAKKHSLPEWQEVLNRLGVELSFQADNPFPIKELSEIVSKVDLADEQSEFDLISPQTNFYNFTIALFYNLIELKLAGPVYIPTENTMLFTSYDRLGDSFDSHKLIPFLYKGEHATMVLGGLNLGEIYYIPEVVN